MDLSKHRRHAVAQQALKAIGDSGCLQVGTVYRQTSARRHEFGIQRTQVYAALIDLLNQRLEVTDRFGLVFMDGDSTDPSYHETHRELKLAQRRVIEDPLFQAAHRSQWIQMADLVAYTAYQKLIRDPHRQFAWDWYDTYVQACDVNDGPRAV